MIEQLTNRYRVLSLLGQGGMGSVYLTEDATTGKQVALKTLSLRAAGDPQEALLRFRQEFRSMARLRHPNIVEVYDFGQIEDGTPFFTMEVVPGQGLDERLPLTSPELTDVIVQLCKALAPIHQQNLVHCDIKPENIRLTPEGCLKLMDFGLMSPAGQTGGGIKGTLAYMAPEVAKRAKVDARSDLYSVGALAYHLISGRPPFPGDDPRTVLRAHVESLPDPLRLLCPHVSEALEQVILRLLAKDPMARYQSTYEVLAALGVESEEHDRTTLFSSPFVGRRSELAAFGEALKALTMGGTGSMDLVGAAGSGKSRLLEEFRFQAQLSGHHVLVGRCLEEGLPYGPFAEILRAAVPLLTPEALAPLRGALSSLLPELAALEVSSALDPQKEKMRLQGAIAELLAQVAQPAGMVLLLDDWHGADASSKELRAVLERHLEHQPILFVAASRESSGKARELPALAREEVAEMTEAILGSSNIDEGFIRQLADATGGNPFFVEGALHHLWHAGSLRRSAGCWQTAGLVLTAADLPSDVHALLVQRLDKLSSDALEIAELAAVIAQPFPLPRLRRLFGGDDEALFEGLSELSREGVLRSDEGMGRFVGGQYAEILYQRLAPLRKAALHAQIAGVLVEEYAGDERLESLFEVARQFLLSDDPRGGVGYVLAAARKSYALFGMAQAKSLLESGLPHVSASSDRLDYLHVLGDISRLEKELDAAVSHYEAALPLARELRLPSREADLLISLGVLHQIRSQYDAAIEVIQQASTLLGAHPDPAVSLRALIRLGFLYNFKGDAAQAIAMTEQALALARETLDEGAISSCLGFLGLLYVQGSPDRLEMGLAYLDESRIIKEQQGDKIGLNETLNLLGNAQMAMGRYLEALGSFERTLTLSREMGVRDDEICALLNLAMVSYELGKFAEGALYAQAGFEGATGNPLYQGISLVMSSVCLAYQGDLVGAQERMAAAQTLARETKNAYLDITVLSYNVEVELLQGRFLDACKLAERAMELSLETGITEYEPKVWALHSEILARLGEDQAAQQALARLRAWATESQAHGAMARALVCEAWLADCHDQTGDSLEAAEIALEATSNTGSGYLEGIAHWLRGSALLRRGRLREAHVAFDQALRVSEEANCPRLKAIALFGQARSEGKSAKAYPTLNQARKVLVDMLGLLGDDDQRSDLLSIDELWCVHRGGLIAHVAGASAGNDAAHAVTIDEMERSQERTAELEAANADLQRIIEFVRETQSLTDLALLLDQIVKLVCNLVGAERGFVLLEEEGRLKIKGSTIDFNDRNPLHWQYSESIVERVHVEGQSRFFADALGGDDQDTSRSIMALQIRAVLCVPLVHREARLGVIYVDRRLLSSPFNEQDQMFAEALASQAAQAIMSVRLFAESESHSRQLEMLNNLARNVSTTLVLSEVLDNVIAFTLSLTGADRAFILLSDDSETLSCHLAKDRSGNILTESNEKVSVSITQRVLTTLEAECVLDTRDHEQFQAQQSILDLNLHTVMCVPLMVKQEPLGVLYVDSQAVVSTFSQRDLDLLRSIASQASVAIQNARLYERATVDGLTKLFVRSYFEQRMSAELRRVLRYGGVMSLLMMDIDHFKKFNDAYGHATGDEVLKLVARVIRDRIREELDIPGRFGGEEMLVLMPETDASGAMILADRLRQAIAETELPGPNGEILHVQVSIGVATVPTHAQTSVELIEFADQALYCSKRNGRNQVTLYDSSVEAH